MARYAVFPDRPLTGIEAMESIVDSWSAEPAFFALTLSLFGGALQPRLSRLGRLFEVRDLPFPLSEFDGIYPGTTLKLVGKTVWRLPHQ